ncbi:MAG: VOC family protein [Lacipirellulaceae bacterium]
MKQHLTHVSLLVRDYDEAIEFFTGKLDFIVTEDTPVPEQSKRWVTVRPPGEGQASLVLARAADRNQKSFIGNQAGGRVFLFLSTDDFWRDYQLMVERGIVFVRDPVEHDYGTVAVFKDLYGNLWDLIQHK